MKKIIFFAFLLTGCMTSQQWVDRQVGADQPQEYKEGYMDGCPSGQKSAGYIYAKFKKNVTRYGQDNLYKQGWDDGFMVCKSKHEALQRDLGPVL